MGKKLVPIEEEADKYKGSHPYPPTARLASN